MCDWCGCQETGHEHGDHHHDHHHDHGPGGHGRVVTVEQDVLARNRNHAEANRKALAARGVAAFNLISSPGAGKTTLLEKSLPTFTSWGPVAVVEGDLQTDNDARRIDALGVPVHQVNTVGGCHLDAHMVGHALEHLDPKGGLLFIENVGNLVCPASFDLGEHARVVVLSVTEGDDKPAKYPVAFTGSDLLVITKVDLLPYVDFDVDRCISFAKAVNRDIQVITCSARTGEGMEAWVDWVRSAAVRALGR